MGVASSSTELSTSAYVTLFFINDTATTKLYTLSLHDALPICCSRSRKWVFTMPGNGAFRMDGKRCRSEEHTSELQSRFDIVCRLLLEKKNSISRSYASDRVGQSAPRRCDRRTRLTTRQRP